MDFLGIRFGKNRRKVLDESIKIEIRKIFLKRPNIGYRSVCKILKLNGVKINHKKVYRLSRELKGHFLM